MLLSAYLNGKYGPCSECPAHVRGLSMPQIQDSLSALTGTSLRHYREIFEMSRFFPVPGRLTNIDDMITILELYQSQKATVTLTFGHPIPAWMNPEFTSGAMNYNAGNLCFDIGRLSGLRHLSLLCSNALSGRPRQSASTDPRRYECLSSLQRTLRTCSGTLRLQLFDRRTDRPIFGAA